MSSLSEKTLILSIGKTIKGFAYLAFSAGAARLYSMEDYAAFQTWWMVFMLFVPIAEGGFTASLYHTLPRLDVPDRHAVTWRTFKVLLALGLALAAFVAGVSVPLAALFDLPSAAPQLQAVALFIGLALPLFAVQAWLLVENRTRQIAYLDIAGAAATGAALLLPPVWGLSPVFGLLILSGYAVVRTLLVAVWFERRLQPRAGPVPIRDQLRYAGQVSSSRAMGVATKQLDRFFVGALGNPQSFSVYATGALEIPLINVMTGSAATVLAPEISARFHNADHAGALRIWHESVRKIALFLFPIGVAATVLAHPLFLVLYGERLAGASQIFQIFALALPLRAAQYGSVLLAAGESTRVFWGSFVGLVFNVGLCLWWVPLWHGIGAALATVVSVYAVVGFYLPALAKAFRCRIIDLFPWRALVKTAAACIPASIGAFLMMRGAASPWVQLLAGSGVFVLVCVPVGLVLGAVRPDDRRRIESYFTKRLHA